MKFRNRMRLAHFYIPALVIYSMFFIYPAISSAFYSFTNWNGLDRTINYVGFENYLEIFRDERFAAAMKNTFIFTLFAALLQNVFGLSLAVFLNESTRYSKIIRTVFYAPAVISPIIVGFIWAYIYHPLFGLIDVTLEKIGLDMLAQDWLGDPRYALGSLIFMSIWQYSGYFMVIYLAGLQGIPQELYEAGNIDGTSRLQRFFYITFPMLAQAITMSVVISIIGSLKVFEMVYATTRGGPGYSTETMATLTFWEAFTQERFGYSTAMAVVLFLIILSISTIQVKILRSREVEA